MNKKILIVDDNETNRDLIANLAEFLGIDFEEAASGKEALEKVKEEPPDLILLDMLMPGMTGYEVAKKLKETPATRHIPVLAVTAKAMPGDREEALMSGCDAYLSKPLDTVAIINKIKEMLGQGHA